MTTTPTAPEPVPTDRSIAQFATSIQGFESAFDSARDISLSWVQTGRTPDTLPSYWAGLLDRPMFYLRDVAHQAQAGHLLGLDEENFAMLRHFVLSSTSARGHYPLWAFEFNGRIAEIDYRSDDDFVREIPAVFELVEKALEQYRWTGDIRYVSAPAFVDYYKRIVFDFVGQHDPQNLGLAGEDHATDIFEGSPTYNEHAGLPDLQVAADGVACQWAAMNAIADVYEELGTESRLAERARQEANRILSIFESLWWDPSEEHYIVGLSKTGRATGFSSEASWFPAVKKMLPAGQRAQSHLSKLAAIVRQTPPDFLESASYLPQAFHAYNFDADAEYWIRYLIASRSRYPEIPFTIVSHLAVGLTGIEANPDGSITTQSHVSSSDWVEVKNISFRGARLSVRHEGQESTELTVENSLTPIRWHANITGQPTREVEVPNGQTVKVSR